MNDVFPVVGFSGISLMAAMPEEKPAPVPPEMRGFFIGQGEHRAFYCILDLMDLSKQDVNGLTAAASRGLPDGTAVHIVSTHNHSAEQGKLLKQEQLAKLAAVCAAEAVEKSAEAEIRFAQGEADANLTMIRRLYLPETEGSFTCFYGTPENRDAAPFAVKAVEQLKQGKIACTGDVFESEKAARTFAPGDRRLAAMQFVRRDNGEPLGSLVRFAAHAICCNSPKEYSADFPGWLRGYLEQKMGGTAVFLNGPCADIAPVLQHKSHETAAKLAMALGKQVVAMLEQSGFQELSYFEDRICRIGLPVRPEVRQGMSEESGLPPTGLPERKRFLERRMLRNTLPFLQEKYRLGIDCPGEEAEVEVALLSLNQVGWLFFPGESFSTTAAAVCAEFSDRQIVTVTEHGRTVMYIPPEEEYRRGGYEPSCALVTGKAEQKLRTQVIRWLAAL